MNMNKRIASIVIMALLIIISLYFRNSDSQIAERSQRPVSEPELAIEESKAQKIDELTRQDRVVSYVQQHQKLPEFYITKMDARTNGWQPRLANLCEVIPGKAIGGDKFLNRERLLPIAPSRQWYEADLNYRCGQRGADRLLYSTDGMIYVTNDHYKSFKKIQ